MIKTICDRCGRETYTNLLPPNYKASLSYGMFETRYDLCKQCLYDVRAFITTKPKQNQTDV